MKSLKQFFIDFTKSTNENNDGNKQEELLKEEVNY